MEILRRTFRENARQSMLIVLQLQKEIFCR